LRDRKSKQGHLRFKMCPKVIDKVLVFLHLKEKKVEKFDYDAHMHLETQGFYNEGLEGTYKCPTNNCNNKIYVYRQVRRQDKTFHDVIRFEQTVPVHPSSKKAKRRSPTPTANSDMSFSLPGKTSISVPVVWNGEVRKPVSEKEYIGQVGKNTKGQKYILVKQRLFASVQCVKCKRDLHLWDELRHVEGEEALRWFLARKADNAGMEKDGGEGSSDVETLVGI